MKISKLKSYQICLIFVLCIFHATIAFALKSDHIQVVNDTAERCIIDLTFPDPVISEFTDNSKVFTAVALPGYPFEDRPGFPMLPMDTIALGVPPRGEVTYTYSVEKPIIFSVGTMKPVPRVTNNLHPPLNDQFFEAPPDVTCIYEINPTVYETKGSFPHDILEQGQDGLLRQQRIISLRLNPIIYHPGDNTIKYYKHVRVEIKFPQWINSNDYSPDDPSFEKIYDQLLINPETARSFRLSRNQNKIDNADTFSKNRNKAVNRYKIVLQDRGFYRITGQDFINFGINLSSEDPQRFKMYYKGQEIAITVYDGGFLGLFETSDYIEFFGLENEDRYSYDSVYFLETGGDTSGLRISSRFENPSSPSSPTSFIRTEHFEEHCSVPGGRCWGGTNYNLTEDEDLWFWLLEYMNDEETFFFDLPHLNTSYFGNGLVRIQLRGVSQDSNYSPDHSVDATLNSAATETYTWDSAYPFTYEFTRNHTGLLVTNNQLTIKSNDLSPNTILNTFYVDWFEIEYSKLFVAENDTFDFFLDPGAYNVTISGFSSTDAQVYDVTDPNIPVVVSNTSTSGSNPYYLHLIDEPLVTTTYFCVTDSVKSLPETITLVPSIDLTDPSNCAEYLIVCHDDFITQANELATHRASLGFVTMVVALSDVYNQFNNGYIDPTSIKDFLRYAYSYWAPPQIAYVLFIGDANVDHKDYQGFGFSDFLPAHYFIDEVSLNGSGWTTNEHWFSRLNGDDYLPDVHLGRLAVSSAAQTQDVVDKLINYDSYPAPIDAWNFNEIFIADNPDGAGNWENATQYIIDNYLPAHIQAVKIYVSQCGSGSACRTEIVDHLNSDIDCAPLVNYYGHGSVDSMAHELIFRAQDVALLTNSDHLPFFLNWTCYNGNFAYGSPVQKECIGEVLVDTAENGAIGFIGSTGLTLLSPNNEYFSRMVYECLLDDPLSRSGMALTYGKTKASLFLCPREVKNTIYLGDPAIELAVAAVPVPVVTPIGCVVLMFVMSVSIVFYKKQTQIKTLST